MVDKHMASNWKKKKYILKSFSSSSAHPGDSENKTKTYSVGIENKNEN
jgi:hypothetical protein